MDEYSEFMQLFKSIQSLTELTMSVCWYVWRALKTARTVM